MVSRLVDNPWPPEWPNNRAADAEAVAHSIQQAAWSRGSAIPRFEQEFASFLGVRYALAVSNATYALRMGLQALGIEPSDEVIVPALTWPSTAVAVLDCGATPVLADIDPRTYCLDTESLAARMTSRTRAVIPVHLYCSAVDMVKLCAFCNRHELRILEDAAQCHGARWGDRSLGCIGHAGVFSFHEKKLLPCGEGGCVVTNDEDIYARLHELRDHGVRAPGLVTDRPPITGGNNRMGTLQAALLSSRLRYLDQVIHDEAENAELLKSELSDLDELCAIERPGGVSLQTYYSFCWKLRSINRDDFLRRVSMNTGIEWAKPYAPLSRGFNDFCSRHPMRKILNQVEANFEAPVAEAAWDSQGIRFHHSVLLAGRRRITWFGEMIRKTIEECSKAGELTPVGSAFK